MRQKFIVDPSMVFGLQNEVNKNLRSAFEKQNSDFTDCLKGFLKMSIAKRKELFGIKSTFSWVEQQENIQIFYNKVYEILGMPVQEIDWNSVNIPDYSEEFSTLDYIDRQITGKQWIKVYKTLFGDDSVYNNDYSKDIDACTKTKQFRPEGNYCITHVGGIEPDKKHLNKSYNMFCEDGNKYMIPVEGIVFATRYRFETGNMLDVKGVTRFHALDTDGCVLGMDWGGGGQFRLGWFNRDDQDVGNGPRQVNF